METITMLGTGNAAVTRCFNTCFTLIRGDAVLLVDTGGGNGVLTQLKRAGIPLSRIHSIFISHIHTDHILGAVWLIRMISAMMRQGVFEGDLCFYGHEEAMGTLLQLARLLIPEKFLSLIGERIQLCTVEDGQTRAVMGCPLTFFDIQSDKAKQFGFSARLDDGESFVFLGDEPYSDAEYPYAHRAGWLMHEAFCLYAQRERFKPYEKHHSTVRDACETARRLEAERLILIHTEDKNLENRKALYTQEGRLSYSGALLVPDDLESIALS